jgi:hypothetical protein
MSSAAQPSPADLQSYFDKVQALYQSLPDLPVEDQPDEKQTLEQDVKKLDVKEQTPEDKVDAYCREFLYIGGPAPTRQSKEADTTT